MGRPGKRRSSGINGVPEVGAFLNMIPRELGKQTVGVVNAMLGPILTTTRRMIKAKRSGLLKKSMAKRVRIYASGIVWGAVGPDKSAIATLGVRRKRQILPRHYAHLVDGGTRPHTIRFKSRRRTMRHPGTAAQPFRLPALEASKSRAVKIGLDKLTKVLNKFNAKGKQ